jgi:hypothetical protein
MARNAPEHNHAILSEAEQAKYLGLGNERVTNLGHPSREDDLTRHPLGQPINYDTAPQAERQIKEGQRHTTGVYQKHSPINSGISSAENLRSWQKYSTSNSYHGKAPAGRGEGSDGHLAASPNPSTKNWADFRAGSESGEGRLEKLRRK